MKDWKYYILFLLLITCLFVYSTYYYNEFLIAQGVIVLIFLFSQFIQFRMFRENTELLTKHFKQDSYQRERFNVITRIDKDILELRNIINQITFEINSPDTEDLEEYSNDLSRKLYTVTQSAESNHLFFKPEEYLIIDKVLFEVAEFSRNESSKSIHGVMGTVNELHRKLTCEFQKSLEL